MCVFPDKYNSQFAGMANQYAYYHEEDESTFQLVDTSKVQKPIYQRGRMKFNQVSQCMQWHYEAWTKWPTAGDFL